MIICLDVGNTTIHAGVFDDNKLINDFRINTKMGWTEDQLGVFLVNYFKEFNVDAKNIEAFVISSVVPSVDNSIKQAITKYFKCKIFEIKPGIKTGILLDKFKNPSEIGADFIVAAIAALDRFPNQNLLIVDMGTATTITALSSKREFLGGVIIPGIKAQMHSIAASAEKLFNVDLINPGNVIGRTTQHAIQSGIVKGHYGALSYLLNQAKQESFANSNCKVIATGGIANLYLSQNLFDEFIPDLLLEGLLIAYNNNKN